MTCFNSEHSLLPSIAELFLPFIFSSLLLAQSTL
uniref:Uncharacterized protein n=1 Tax=Rhizophora mucronata TaxID=61149 RepID=A0A2P2QKT1_RHIMU